MEKIKHFFLAALVLQTLGCSFGLGGAGTLRTNYVLNAQPSANLPIYSTRNERLVIKNVTTNRFLSGTRIIFSSDPNERHFYQFAAWVDAPPNYFTEILLDKLEKTKLFQSVAESSAGVAGDWDLNFELLEFYHDTSRPPGAAKMSLRVQLVNHQTRRVIASHIFSGDSAVSSFDAKGAVEAFEAVSNSIAVEVAEWIYQVLPTLN